jgi:hypothetical protein
MTDETTETKTRIRAAWLRIDREHGFCHPVLAFGNAADYERDEDGVSFSYAGGFDAYRMRKPYGLDLEDFRVTAQGEIEKPGDLYGWEFEFAKHRVRESDVKAMSETFRTVRRALDKARASAGECASWADFALRVCVALKIDRLYVRRPDSAMSECHATADRVVVYNGERIRDGLAHGERMLWTHAERERVRAAS